LVRTHTSEIIEHITHEKQEIQNIQGRIEDLSLDDISSIETQKQLIQHAAVSYLGNPKSDDQGLATNLPEPPCPEPTPQSTPSQPPVTPNPVTAPPSNAGPDDNTSKTSDESEWLSRMEAQ